jgi:hypothetical protein
VLSIQTTVPCGWTAGAGNARAQSRAELLRLRGLESKAKGLDLVIPLSRFGVHVADQFRLFLRRATYGIGWGWES